MWRWWEWHANCLLSPPAAPFLSDGWVPSYALFFPFVLRGSGLTFGRLQRQQWKENRSPMGKQWDNRLSTSIEPRQKTSCFPGPFNGLQRLIQFLTLRGRGGLSTPNKLEGERVRQDLGEQMYSLVSLLLPLQERPQGSECPQIPRAKALIWLGQASA